MKEKTLKLLEEKIQEYLCDCGVKICKLKEKAVLKIKDYLDFIKFLSCFSSKDAVKN